MRSLRHRLRSIIVSAGAIAVTFTAVNPTAVAAATQDIPSWQSYVRGPSSATVHPIAITSVSGSVNNAAALTGAGGEAVLTTVSGGTPASVVLDYGQDTSGVPVLNVSSQSGSPTVHEAFSEALTYLGTDGDTGGRANDVTVNQTGRVSTGSIQGGQRFERITLSTPGSITLSSVGIDFTPYRATSDAYQGHFLSSDDQLNHIWYDGAYSTQLCQLPANSLPVPWSVSNGSLDANGGDHAVLTSGAGWNNYTMSVETSIVSQQSGWLIGTNADASVGFLFILDSQDDASGPRNTLQELYSAGSGQYSSVGSVALPNPLATGTWHQVRTVVSDNAITISLDGSQIATVNPSQLGHSARGTVGLREYGGERARFRNLSVTSSDGSSLYRNPLSDASALSAFSGPAVDPQDPLPVLVDGAKRDRWVWSGDLGVEGRNIYYSTNTTEYVRESMRLLDSYQNGNGASTTTVTPTTRLGTFPQGGWTYSAQYSMDEVLNLEQYYQYTGDLDFIRNQWPMITRELAYNATLVDSRGLLVTDSGNGMDWDSDDPAHTGAVTSYNATYYGILMGAAGVAADLGDVTSAQQYSTAAANLRQAANTTSTTEPRPLPGVRPDRLTFRRTATHRRPHRHGSGRTAEPHHELSGAGSAEHHVRAVAVLRWKPRPTSPCSPPMPRCVRCSRSGTPMPR
jgi:alpha-L-rhamnosidase